MQSLIHSYSLEDYTIFEFALLLIAGIITGIVNTIAGSGTIFSMGAMIFMDVPIELANTTNRLGVLFQNISGIVSFRKHGNSNIKIPVLATMLTLSGALIGAYFASIIDRNYLEWIALIVIVLMIIQTVTYRLKKDRVFRIDSPVLLHISFFLVGLYGGFIQIGVGILMLLCLKNSINNWMTANYVKLSIILIYTIPTVVFFGFSGMILWKIGLILTVGQVIGAYFAGWIFNVNEGLKSSIDLIVIVMLVLTGLRIAIF
jgi:hypothetical protein